MHTKKQHRRRQIGLEPEVSIGTSELVFSKWARLLTERIAILPWGGVVEDFLEPISVSLEEFATEMTGGWLFGYAAALERAGATAFIVCFSKCVAEPTRFVHPKTEVVTVALPMSSAYRWLRTWPGDPDGAPATQRVMLRGAQEGVRYMATSSKLLREALQRENCTVLLNQEYEYPRFRIASGVARGLGLPVFATFQGGVPIPNALIHVARAAPIRSVDGLIIASSVEIERVRQTYGIAADKIAQIPNPLDLALWYPEPRSDARAALDLPDTARVAICHARIEYHRKGFDILIEAWRRLTGRHPQADLRLHLIGSGAGDSDLEADLAKGGAPRVRWVRTYTGDRAAMRRELSAADAYVLASRHEGFPVAPLEAMACGQPAVLADAPGAADILASGEADGGFVVPREDPDALANALAAVLLDDDRRARMARAARLRVEAFASLEAVGEQLLAFISRSSRVTRAS